MYKKYKEIQGKVVIKGAGILVWLVSYVSLTRRVSILSNALDSVLLYSRLYTIGVEYRRIRSIESASLTGLPACIHGALVMDFPSR